MMEWFRKNPDKLFDVTKTPLLWKIMPYRLRWVFWNNHRGWGLMWVNRFGARMWVGDRRWWMYPGRYIKWSK